MEEVEEEEEEVMDEVEEVLVEEEEGTLRAAQENGRDPFDPRSERAPCI